MLLLNVYSTVVEVLASGRVIGTGVMISTGNNYSLIKSNVDLLVYNIDLNGVFSKIVLKSKSSDVPNDINLYKPVRDKVYFHQLKV